MAREPERDNLQTLGPGALSKEKDSNEYRRLSHTARARNWSPQQLWHHLAQRGEAPDSQLRTSLHTHKHPS